LYILLPFFLGLTLLKTFTFYSEDQNFALIKTKPAKLSFVAKSFEYFQTILFASLVYPRKETLPFGIRKHLSLRFNINYFKILSSVFYNLTVNLLSDNKIMA